MWMFEEQNCTICWGGNNHVFIEFVVVTRNQILLGKVWWACGNQHWTSFIVTRMG